MMRPAYLAPLMAAFVFATPVSAQTPTQTQRGSDRDRVELDFARDRFASGNVVLVRTPVAGDLIATGRRVEINTQVEGDAITMGGDVHVNGRVGQDLYAAGGNLLVSGAVARNARIAGGQVSVAPNAQIEGNVSVAGGEVRIEGRVNGYVQVAGGRVYLNAPIGGDVQVTADHIELGPGADISGSLSYASKQDLRRDPGARIGGSLERRPPPSGWPLAGGINREIGIAAGWIWTIGLMLLAGLFVALLPGVSARGAATLRGRFGWSLLAGFGVVIGAPIAILLLMVTLIGIPLALLSVMLYIALLFLGYATAGVTIGDWALGRVKRDEAPGRGWRIGATVLAVLVLGLLGRISGLGTVITALALFAGIGAIVLLMFRKRPAPTAV